MPGGDGVDSERFVACLRRLWDEKGPQIEAERNDLREQYYHGRDDWIWWALCLSMATYRPPRQGSEAVGRVFFSRYNEISYSSLRNLDPMTRRARLKRFYSSVSHRDLNKKVNALEANFRLIENEYGGPEGFKRQYELLNTANSRMRLLSRFKLIGKAYARNIPMDVSDPIVTRHVKFDWRVNQVVASCLGEHVAQMPYRTKEALLIQIAEHLGLDGYQIDRLMFQNKAAIIECCSR